MLWQIDIYPADGQPDIAAKKAATDARDLGVATDLSVASAHGYLIQGDLTAEQAQRIADQLLADRVVERTVVAPTGDGSLAQPPNGRANLVHVLPKPGVMDPVAHSAQAAIANLGICLLYTSPSPRDATLSRMPSSA